MGGGRKTKTIWVSESSSYNTSSYNTSSYNTSSYNPNSIARLLNKADLGGVIFGCKHSTISECLKKNLFGLPGPHFNYIQNIEPGLPLFLFNYSDRMLHGVYEAAGYGQMNIDPYAWTEGGHGKTTFPAQVRIQLKIYCQPIAEKMFQPIMKENYYTTSHFYFELDHKQVKGLISLFTPTHKVDFPPRSMQTTLSTNEGMSRFRTGTTNLTKKEEDAKPKSWDELFPKNTYASPSGEEDIPNSKSCSNNSIECDVKRGTMSSENDENREVGSDWEELDSNEKHQNPINRYNNTDFVHNREDSSSDYNQHTSLDDDELSQQMSEHEFNSDCVNTETERILDKLKKMASNAPVAASGEVCRDNSLVSSTMNLTEDGPEQESVTKNDSLHENTELMQVVKELSAKTIMLERKLIENKREMEQLRTTLKISDKKYQRMQERMRDLETKVDPSIPLLREALNDSQVDLPFGHEKLIYVIGGHNGKTWLDTLDSYSVSLDIMTPLKRMSHSRSYVAAMLLNGNILVCGGGCGTENLWYKTVECYNPRIDEWTLFPSMTREKGSLAGATLNGKAFAIGGGDGSECFSDVEMFDPILGRWIHAQSLHEKRFALAACELNGALYAVGGYDGNDYLNSTERYDPRESTWARFASMKTRRACHSMTVLNEKLYVMGGYDSQRMVCSTEVFDPRAGSWYVTDPMNNVRGYAAAAVLGESLYVIGGVKDMETTEDTVECYREGVGWAVTGLKAAGKRSFSSVVVI